MLFRSRRGHASVARILLQCGADPAALDNMNRTPSQVAAEGGYRRIIELLSKQGADKGRLSIVLVHNY